VSEKALLSVDPPQDRIRWTALYRDAFPRLYRALVAALLEREAALDGLHDAFEEGLRKPPVDERGGAPRAMSRWSTHLRSMTAWIAPSIVSRSDGCSEC
jgi:DNA-directed RNA polymerase specialized sigma24 family protein